MTKIIQFTKELTIPYMGGSRHRYKMHNADIVIDSDGVVIKDCDSATGRQATEEELKVAQQV